MPATQGHADESAGKLLNKLRSIEADVILPADKSNTSLIVRLWHDEWGMLAQPPTDD